MFNATLIRQVFKYGTVGILSLGVDVGVFTLARHLQVELFFANTLARLSGALTAYSGNYLWTFSKPQLVKKWLKTSWKYTLLWAFTTTVSTLLINTLMEYSTNETVAKICVELLMPVMNFVIARYWVYR